MATTGLKPDASAPVSASGTKGETVTIEECDGAALAAALEDFADLLHAAVHDGASIGFVLPFALEEARAFWLDKVRPAVDRGGVTLLAARIGDRVVATVQLARDMPANQPHRGEIRKLIVHPAFRRRGIARLLMAEIEARARAAGRGLLTLDTRTGDHAEPLYASMGYHTAGVIPGYCVDAITGALDGTTIMYKAL